MNNLFESLKNPGKYETFKKRNGEKSRVFWSKKVKYSKHK